MTEHTAPDPTEMNSFSVLVATSAEQTSQVIEPLLTHGVSQVRFQAMK